MKLKIASLVLIMTISGCSTYSVKTEVDTHSSLKEAKKLGVIVRVPLKSRITRDEILTSLSHLLNGYDNIAKIDIIPDLSAQLIEFSDDEDRFYQPSSDQEFLKYKSIGILRTYLRTNADEIKKIMEKNALDGIIIYEVYGLVSVEMQLLSFDSVIAITDKNADIVYLDHQNNDYQSAESDYDSQRAEVLNHISNRFIESMKNLGYVRNIQ
ncbi:MAG TPA: hypothetical protein VF857_04345 [Spirochaetota bacterium]